ncbi:sporulation protein YpjB [Paenibacillus aestuarii]|uniref:Sporulation protein YpjB n=1 Tax=Paenibacillus aestuarii TaxID=516965 RepID=A0ABW0K4D6_9BACL|nr:sporulation protein YpjB [Paenibacillus aestuarii]
MLVGTGTKRLATVVMIIVLIGLLAGCGAVPSEKETTAQQADPEQMQKMEFLNQVAEDMYNKTMEGQVVEARSKLQQISDQIPKIHFEGVTSVEGLNALTETITQAKRVFNAASYSNEEGKVAVAKIRLATDALTHKNQPMWLQYYKVLQNDIDELKSTLRPDGQKAAMASYTKLSQHLGVIRPSLLISRQPADVEKLDSLMTFLHSLLNQNPLPMRQLGSGMDHLQQTIDELFMKNKDAIAFVPVTDPIQPIIWSIGIGFIIVSVLSFSAWRMYRSGKHVVPVRRQQAKTREKEYL